MDATLTVRRVLGGTLPTDAEFTLPLAEGRDVYITIGDCTFRLTVDGPSLLVRTQSEPHLATGARTVRFFTPGPS